MLSSLRNVLKAIFYLKYEIIIYYNASAFYKISAELVLGRSKRCYRFSVIFVSVGYNTLASALLLTL